MTKRRAILLSSLLTTLLVAFVSLIYTQTGPLIWPSLPQPQPGFYRVTEVYDGDTFAVSMNGTTEKIRLIGVDTPETHKPNTPVQCFGPEASDFTKKILASADVRLEADPTGDNRDRYNRLLRYAYLPDGRLLQALLIEDGYGFAYLSFTFTKKTEFADLQEQAKASNRGLWAACKTTLKNGRWQTD